MSRSHRVFAWSLVLALLCAFVGAAEKPQIARAAGKTFTVTTTSDTFVDPAAACNETLPAAPLPTCTLRQALNAANAPGNGGSRIEFQIQRNDPGYTNFPPGSPNAWIITPTLALPPLVNDGIVIDASTQTNRVGNDNNDGAEVIIDGAKITNAGGLWIKSSGNTVRGIGIINFRANGSRGTLKGVGIEISGDNNTIQGNYIGLGISAGGSVAGPNIDAGVIIYGKNNQIGGDVTALTTQFNVISGNTGDGIFINGGDSNTIAGNYIGTNGTVSAAVPNGGSGINIRNGADGNIIGNFQTGDAARFVSFRNFISGNNGYGIQIKDSLNNKIYGNFIGLSLSGTAKISNALGGIRIDGTSTNSATGNSIGATSPDPLYMRNYIAGSAGPGIQINGFGARQNQIVANYIGVGSNNALPAGAPPQLSTGILLDDGASDNIVGGSLSAGAHNVVAGISGDGIRVAGFFQPSPLTILRAQNNTVSGNYVGVAPDGTSAIRNTGSGIVLDTYVVNTTVGGTTADLLNIVANNDVDGITIQGTNVTTTTIQKNTVSFNTDNGVNITGASGTTINGGGAAGANQITDNGANGIKVSGGTNTSIRFNSVRSNAQNGILVDGAASDIQITGNTIYTNTLNGVLVQGGAASPQKVRILDNSMQGNQKGIELTPDGGVATSPNHGIAPPYALQIDQTGRLSGRVRLTPTNPAVAACAQPCMIQVFGANPKTLDRQGRDKINVSPEVTPDSKDPSFGTFSAALGGIPAQIVVTATDKDGNTSEFEVITPTAGLAIGPPREGVAYPGEVITYTHRITNTGNIAFTNLQLTAVSSRGWPYKLAPANPIALMAGESKPVTLTLTLPTGADARVRADAQELTTVTVTGTAADPKYSKTASVTDTTRVQGRFILDVAPRGRNGFGVPGANIDYPHILTNTGNQTGTVTITATTLLPDPVSGPVPAPSWVTSVAPISVTLAPGRSVGITARVVVPTGTLSGTVALTRVSFSGSSATNNPSAVITDTTTTLRRPLAFMEFPEEQDAGAGETVQFCHTVTNQTNGPATFRLTGVSSLGSKIVFVSNTPGVQLVNGGTFTVGITDSNKSFSFCAKVTVDVRALPGQKDLVAIGLTDTNGAVVGGTSLRDTVNVVRSAMAPRLLLPIIGKAS